MRFSAVALVCLPALFAGSAFASQTYSPSSSWSSQQSWDSDNSSSSRPVARSKTIASRLKEPDVSPFAPGSNNVALEMGQVFLMGNLGSGYSDSIGEGIHYTYGVSDLFAFDSSLGYSSHSDGKLSMFNATAGLRTNLAWYDKIVPYFAFGLGFYRPSMTVSTGSGATAGTDSLSPVLFGVHVGPGVDLAISKQLFFGASLTFHDIFGNTQTTITGTPVDVGGTYTAFFLHAGYTF